MTTKTNNFEGGTNTATITTANSAGASGTAWDVLSFPGGSAVYDTSSAANGTLGAKIIPASGSQAILRHSGFAAKTGVARIYLTSISALPGTGTNEALISVDTAADGAIFQVVLTPQGNYGILDATYSYLNGTTATYLAGDRLEVSWSIGTTTSNSAYTLKLFRGNSTTAVETVTGSAANFGTTNWGYAQYGKSSTSTWTATLKIDGVYAADGTTTLPGPEVAANAAPTASIDAAQTADAYATVTHSGAGSSDSDGTIATWAWTARLPDSTPVTLTGASTNAISYAAPGTLAGTTVTVTLTVTDNKGATGTTTVTDTIRAANERAVVSGVEVPMLVRST